MNLYLLIIWNDTEPEVLGPYDTDIERDQAARNIREEEGEEHGIFKLEAEGEATISTYSGGFFDV